MLKFETSAGVHVAVVSPEVRDSLLLSDNHAFYYNSHQEALQQCYKENFDIDIDHSWVPWKILATFM